MLLPTPLYAGRLVQRYKRFLADVILENGPRTGATVTAHLADPGRLPDLAVPDARVWLSYHDDPKRRLSYTVQLIENRGTLVATNTSNANRLAAEALAEGSLDRFGPILSYVREPRIDEGTRLDFKLVTDTGETVWLEIKTVTWRRDQRTARTGLGAFPDAVTARGRKHLRTLASLTSRGERAALLFVAMRNDLDRVSIASDIDPAYAEAFKEACKTGIEVHACTCQINLSAISIHRFIPLVDFA